MGKLRTKIIDNQVCRLITVTLSCSGCTETSDGYNVNGYETKNGILIGSGCKECGYQGKRRNQMWVPVTPTPERNAQDE